MNKNELRYRRFLAGTSLVVVCLVCVFSCSKEEFPELPSLVMDDPITELDSIQITARINLKEIDGSRITESGFHWARVGDPAMTMIIPMEPIPDNANSADFTGIWTGLQLNENYYFQAYIRLEGSGMIHSEIDTTSTKAILLSTSFSGTGERVDDTEKVRLFGRLSGLRDGVTVGSVGHIWIVRDEGLPDTEWNNFDINSADSIRSFDPNPPQDGSIYFDDVVWLDPAQYYYVLPFAEYNGVPVYGNAVEIFIGNIWKKVGNLPGGRLANAVSFVIEDKAYIVTGARRIDAANLELADFSEDVIICDPAVNSYSTDADNPFPGKPRIDAVAFTLNGRGYVGSGRDSANIILNDFWSYDPSLPSGRWQSVDTIPLRVYDAFSFVVESQGLAYVGSGNSGISNNEPDFSPTAAVCAFNGTSWNCTLSLNTVPAGLANAVSWNVNGTPYVATGHQKNQSVPLLRTIHFFQSEINTFDRFQPQFAGSPRQSAVAFTIDTRVYMGAGSNQVNGIDPTYHDFFVFDFEHSELGWREIDNLGNAFNCGATAFSLNGKGYICGGLEKFALQFPLVSIDIWEYTPSPNN